MSSEAMDNGGLMQPKRSQRLGQMLCDQGLLTEQQLESALKHQKDVAPDKLLGEVLIELELVRAEDMVAAVARSLNLPYVELTAAMVEPEALECLPGSFIEKHNLLPVTVAEGWLTIAVEHFTDVVLLEEIGRRSGCQVQVLAATGDNIARTRREVIGTGGHGGAEAEGGGCETLDGILGEIDGEQLTFVEQEESDPPADLEAAAADSPVVRLVNHIIHKAAGMRASDIHIEPADDTFRVRYRIDGELVETIRPSARLLPAVVSRIKIVSGMDISERRLPQDGGFSVTVGERAIDLRISTMAAKSGEKVVMRLVDRSASITGLDSLGFAPAMLKDLRGAISQSNGIVLVTGPTGSGKSTTLYGALAEIVSDTRNISTIEDPVERRLPGTNQFQVHTQAGFTFARALRSLLRQDPDVVMVGEIRDAETARLATEAALTGHMVLSTLHTNDAPTAVPRLVNMGVEPYLVAASLRAVLAQRLVRRICPHCRKKERIAAATAETLAELCGGECPIDTCWRGAGCSRCRGKGYFGRVGVFELMMLNEQMLSAIIRDPSIRPLRAAARRRGFKTLLEDGLEKVREGLIGVEGLLEIATRADEQDDAPMHRGPEHQAA